MNNDPCSACDGTGWSNGIESNGQCRACNGTGSSTAQTSN